MNFKICQRFVALAINIINMKFKIKKAVGMSKGGYYHIPLLFVGFGRDGFLITILGIAFSCAWGNER